MLLKPKSLEPILTSLNQISHHPLTHYVLLILVFNYFSIGFFVPFSPLIPTIVIKFTILAWEDKIMAKMLTFLIVVGIEYLKSPVIYQVRLVGGRRCTVDYGVMQFLKAWKYLQIFQGLWTLLLNGGPCKCTFNEEVRISVNSNETYLQAIEEFIF